MLFERLAEISLPLLTWTIITLPLWLSPFAPELVAYFIIAFDLYFLYKALTTAFFAGVSYYKINLASKIDFAGQLRKLPEAKEILHLVIIPNYKEPLYKLEETLNKILQNDFPYKKNLYVVLGFEEREEKAVEKAQSLKEKFKGKLNIISTFHNLAPNEVAGKASNQTFALKKAQELLKDKIKDPKKVIVTTCDADSLLPKNYFSYLTFKFLQDKNRQFHFYWAPLLLYNNFEKLPFFVRVQATISSILRLATLSQSKKNLIQISTYSTNLWLLKSVGYWEVDVIPEDWHIYLQAFLKFGEKVQTLPLYTIVSGDAVYSGGILRTLFNRYEQEKRWAWGVTDVAYLLKNFFKSKVPFWPKFKKLIYLTETHLFWPTSFFILTISASLPPLINPAFKRTTFGFYLPKLAAFILTLSTSMIIVYLYLDFKLREALKKKNDFRKLPLFIVQWYFLPAISFLLSSLPALEAHTRLLLNKKIEYKVTEKV